MPRITPVTGKAEVAPEYHYVVDQVVDVFGGVRGPFSILLHSPKLAERLLKLVTFNREESVVPGELRERSNDRSQSVRTILLSQLLSVCRLVHLDGDL